MRSTAPTLGCGPSWSAAVSAMCWRWPVTIGCSPPVTPGAPTPSSGGSRRGLGSASRPVRAPRATATTTGRSSAWTTRPCTWRSGWAALAAGPPQPQDRRAGLLPLLHAHPVPLTTLVRVAGWRWTIEERFQTGKGLCGLDAHQVRCWRSWYRWATLAMLAHAFLVVAALTDRTRPPPSELIGLTCNEVQHLLAALLARPAGDHGHRLRWSLWRHRHQARARTCHYHRQAT